MKTKVVALLIKGFGLIALSMWFYAGHLYEVFRTYPTVPNPEAGKVIPFLWKSQYVYISESENLQYSFFFYGAIVVFITAAFGYAWAHKKFKDTAHFSE